MTNTSCPFAFFEGKIIPTEEAKVSIMTNALQYGTGIFSGMRGYYNADSKTLNVFRMDDHIERFLESLKILGVSIKYSHEELKKIVTDLVIKNKPETDVYFRPFAYAGSLNLAPNLDRDSVFEFALYMIPMGDYLPTNKGLSVGVSAWERISDNAIPSRAKISGGYINSALAKKDAHLQGFDEAIFLNSSGHVAEGSAMNIFLVRRGKLITPAVSEDILEGITRRSIMQIASDMKIEVTERAVDKSELYIADEVFFSGTAAQIAWINKVDGRTVGTGEQGDVSKKIQEVFFNIVRGKDAKYSEWLTEVRIS
ncbi:MAG: branched-chain amino acid transaminase [Candidatus Levybacteria bacterium]|nr:branched-chain amino acid transaminase [Candidatus Levybacteria bacterium]